EQRVGEHHCSPEEGQQKRRKNRRDVDGCLIHFDASTFPSSQRRGGATAAGWSAGVVGSAETWRAELTTPAAPPARWLSAQPLLLCEEGNMFRSPAYSTRPACV